MSYFVTSAGPRVTLRNFPPVELVDIELAQYYVKDLASMLRAGDGEPLFLVHDGESNTSHDLVVPAENEVIDSAPLDGTALGKIIAELLYAGHTIRIWDAGAISRSEVLGMPLVEYDSPAEALASIVQGIHAKHRIQFRGRLTGRATGRAGT
jgi:hypothetical protein